jgi:hypothetical protein
MMNVPFFLLRRWTASLAGLIRPGPEDVASTIDHSLSIPLDATHDTPNGGPIHANYDGQVNRELV